MRKLKFCFILSLVMGIMIGCSSSKVKDSDDYSASDYAEMVDYMYDAISEMEVINRTADPSDLDHVKYLCQQVVSEYPYAKEYLIVCQQAIADDNEKLIEKADEEKLDRILDCAARGWFNQW